MPSDKDKPSDGHQTDFSQQVELAAQSMIERFGKHAQSEASLRAIELDSFGDSQSAELWRRVAIRLQQGQFFLD
jgi:hypothetical protein